MCLSAHKAGSCLAFLLAAAPALAQETQPDETAPPAPATAAPVVYLYSVRVNGWPLGLTAHFEERDGRLAIPADQFDGLGFKVEEAFVTSADGQRLVFLDQVPDLTWEIDARAQTINLRAPYARLRPNVLRISPAMAAVAARSDWGAMLAYDVYGEWSSRANSTTYGRSVSVNLEARLFSPWFMATTTGFYSWAAGARSQFVRLDSSIEFDDPAHARRLRLGDSFTQGPAWLRTVRFGGIQWGTDFGMRPDIVTTPVATLSQNVGVPSTVDLFINGVRRYSNNVDPGPVRVTDLPVLAGSNSVQLVVTEPSGRRSVVTLPLYSSSLLLAPGMTSFSIEAGAPRRNYAVASNDYGEAFVSGSISHGLTRALTVRAYGGATRNFVNIAGGATFSIGNLAVVDAAAGYSDGPAGSGWAWYGSIEHARGRFNFYASYMHAQRGFRDLAGRFGYTTFRDQANVSLGASFGRFGSLYAGYVMQRLPDGEVTSVIGGTYGLDLFRRRLHLTFGGSWDTNDDDWSVSFSLSFNIGRTVRAYANQRWRNDGESTYASISGHGFGNRLDWNVSGERGAFEEVAADATWDGQKIDAYLRVAQSQGDTGVRAELAQSLVFMDGRLVLAGRIDDGFTIVDVEDAPGIRVSLENHPVGRTNSRGRLFVTGLQSWSPNAISIDPQDLPLNASISDTAMLVAPRNRGGLVTRFPVSHDSAAIVVLRRPGGSPPPVGAEVRVQGSDAVAVVGFDGEVYVRGLQAGAGRLEVRWPDGSCTASFTAPELGAGQSRLGPYICAP